MALAPSTRPQRIGELARDLGLTSRTLRFWEERGLLPPAARSAKGYRLYGLKHVRAARGVVQLKASGLSLHQIDTIQRGLGQAPTALMGLGTVQAALQGRALALRRAISAQRSLLSEIESALSRLQICNGCDGKPYDHDCIRCLERVSEVALPATLAPLLQTAADRKTTRPDP